MTHRTYTLLRVVLIINLCFLLFGIMRVGVVGWRSSPEGHGTSVHRRRDAIDPCDITGQDDVHFIHEAKPRMPSRMGEELANETIYQVPNIVHYIWYNEVPKPLQFHHMLSILSAHKLLDPDVIYFHTNMEPNGEYWNIVKALPKFKVKYREPPTTLFGEALKGPFFYTSYSNVDRVKILMEYGGIYLDFDVLITRPFEDLRRHVCTIGLEQETKACGSIIICSKTSFFLSMWINAYLDDYRIEEWAYNTGKVPYKISRRFPHLVHVEKMKLNRPNFKELDKIWGPTWFDWERNYAVHIWYRLWKDTSPYYQGFEPNPQNIKTWNGTFGEMARSILYGNKRMIAWDDPN